MIVQPFITSSPIEFVEGHMTLRRVPQTPHNAIGAFEKRMVHHAIVEIGC